MDAAIGGCFLVRPERSRRKRLTFPHKVSNLDLVRRPKFSQDDDDRNDDDDNDGDDDDEKVIPRSADKCLWLRTGKQ